MVNHQRITYWSRRHRINDHPPMSKSSPRNHERSIVGVVTTEPQAIHRRDTRNPAAAATPAPRIDDTPKRQAGRQLIGKETEGYVRSSKV